MRVRSWVTLLVCLPLAVAGAVALDQILHACRETPVAARPPLPPLLPTPIPPPPESPIDVPAREVDLTGHTMLDRLMNPGLPRGALAPDFALARLSDRQPLRLSQVQGAKPVVLVFGGFT